MMWASKHAGLRPGGAGLSGSRTEGLPRWVALLCLISTAAAADFGDVLNGFPYRNLGPFRAGGWVSAIAVADNRTFYVAARTGGVWKTVNNGISFEPVTDSQGIASLGAVAVAPGHSDIVWVGAGDNSVTRSAYYGDGVYKSTDGGKTWQNMGLRDTQHISRILIHPTNPDIVWVAAIGHLFSANQERGIFKTTDGGKTWQKTLYVGDTVGAIDLVSQPDAGVLYAAMYEAVRYPWKIADGGPGSGIFRSNDGGETWHKLENGLPQGPVGRIGLDLCRSHPETLYAVVDNFNPAGERRAVGGEVYRSDDAGAHWRKMNAASDDVSRKAGYSFNQIRVDPNNPERVYITGSSMLSSNDGGKTWAGLGRSLETVFRRAFGDFRTLWIDPGDSNHMLAGSDGGVFVSYDGGKTCEHLANLKLGEVYAIGADMDQPYHIYAGLQDHENWRGPVDGPSGEVGIEDWVTTGIGDGMYNEVDPAGRWLYNTQEFGHLARVDLEQWTRTIIAPTRPSGQPYLRFNWTAPIRISPHDGRIIYAGAQVLLRSKDRGDHWEEISPDLTTGDASKISPPNGSIQFCTITTIAESPAQAGVIWVGTDDGKVQVTRDAGAHWTDATVAITAAGGPADAWVTRVYGSRFEAGTAYVTKSRKRQDDFRPFVFRTTDFGAHWSSLSHGLPAAGANAIVEDTVRHNLLFAGTDAGVYVSFDTGETWHPFKANMPVVPVSDLMVQPREGDLIAGTYGRGIWVTNIVPLRGMANDFANTEAALLPIRPFAERHGGAWGNYRLYGESHPVTPNEPNGVSIVYYLREAPQGPVKLAVSDSEGHKVRDLNAAARPGIGRVIWTLSDEKPGEYAVTLTVDGKQYSQKAVVVSRAPADSPRGRRF